MEKQRLPKGFPRSRKQPHLSRARSNKTNIKNETKTNIRRTHNEFKTKSPSTESLAPTTRPTLAQTKPDPPALLGLDPGNPERDPDNPKGEVKKSKSQNAIF
eukprot:9437361-Pyramimonas_sp.AAC.1